jgi:hypothetical protein
MTPKSSQEDGDQANVNPDEFITEFMGLHLLVDEAISSLLRLSVQIHKSSTKAKFVKSSVDKSYATGPDISHVRDLFPHLETTGNIVLAEKLPRQGKRPEAAMAAVPAHDTARSFRWTFQRPLPTACHRWANGQQTSVPKAKRSMRKQ